MSDKKPSVAGGDLNKNLQGDYQFNIRELFKEAWTLTQARKWILLKMAGVVLIISVTLVLILLQVFAIDDLANVPPNIQVTIDLVITVLLAPLMAAMMATGVNHSVGGHSKLSHLFRLLPKSAMLGLTALMVTLMVQAGLSLLILPGLYLIMATSFSLLLVAEKKLSAVQAIIMSIRMVNRYLGDFVKVYLLITLMFASLIFTFGISAIWVIPMHYHIKGILYRDLFGITVFTHISKDEIAKGESVFHA